MVGDAAAGTSATVGNESWLAVEAAVELVAGRGTDDGTETGRVVGTDSLEGDIMGSRAETKLGG